MNQNTQNDYFFKIYIKKFFSLKSKKNQYTNDIFKYITKNFNITNIK